MITSPAKFGLCAEAFLFLYLLTAPAAQEASVNVEGLLEDALYLLIDVDIRIPENQTKIWETRVEKITVPGRPVELSLYGENSSLRVGLTLYPAERDKLLLVAKSEIRIGSEDYSSTLTSLPVEYRDAVYYYPLGRSSELIEYMEVRMAIEVTPYLDTLSEEDRDAIESALDSTAQFDLSRESSESK